MSKINHLKDHYVLVSIEGVTIHQSVQHLFFDSIYKMPLLRIMPVFDYVLMRL